MKITEVRIKKIEGAGKLKAVASVTLDEQFVIHDIKIIDGDKGMFIAMPNKKNKDGSYSDIAHPINTHVRTVMQDTILEIYREEND